MAKDPDVEVGQLVPYAPRSRKSLEITSRALNLRSPPTGVVVAQPASSVVASLVRSRTRRGKTETHTYQVTDGMLYAGLGLFFLFELDKFVSAWAGSVGADLAGLNPINWIQNGMNSVTAMDQIKSAEQQAANAAKKVAQTPPTATTPSNVGYVAGLKLGAPGWASFWEGLAAQVRSDFQQHKLEPPPTG